MPASADEVFALLPSLFDFPPKSGCYNYKSLFETMPSSPGVYSDQNASSGRRRRRKSKKSSSSKKKTEKLPQYQVGEIHPGPQYVSDSQHGSADSRYAYSSPERAPRERKSKKPEDTKGSSKTLPAVPRFSSRYEKWPAETARWYTEVSPGEYEVRPPVMPTGKNIVSSSKIRTVQIFNLSND